MIVGSARRAAIFDRICAQLTINGDPGGGGRCAQWAGAVPNNLRLTGGTASATRSTVRNASRGRRAGAAALRALRVDKARARLAYSRICSS